MSRIVAIHRLELGSGVDRAAFEEFVRGDVFPGLSIVIHVNKMISHGFTKIRWMEGEHVLLRPQPSPDTGGTYLWMITAPVDESELDDADKRQAVESELRSIAEQFYDLGSTLESTAAHKLKPFATRTSLETYLETARRTDT
jgi:hypothetical protein